MLGDRAEDYLLDVARIVTGKIQLRIAPTDLAGVVDAAVDAVRHTAGVKGLALAARHDRPVPPTLADADRLPRVVWNVLTNAIRFTPEGGHIDVGLTARDGHAIIEVTDDGIGIDAGFLPHVFDRFRQAETGTTRRTGGFGLGLSIVRHLTELHGGLVHAGSEGEGRGATALEAGFQAHVVKPLDPMQLVALLARLVQAARPAVSGTGIAWSCPAADSSRSTRSAVSGCSSWTATRAAARLWARSGRTAARW